MPGREACRVCGPDSSPSVGVCERCRSRGLGVGTKRPASEARGPDGAVAGDGSGAPEVIDLISDSDGNDEEEEQEEEKQAVKPKEVSSRSGGGDEARKQEPGTNNGTSSADDQPDSDGEQEQTEEAEPELFMSRVFLEIVYAVSDFPTEADAVAARKKHARAMHAALASAETSSVSSSATSSAASMVGRPPSSTVPAAVTSTTTASTLSATPATGVAAPPPARASQPSRTPAEPLAASTQVALSTPAPVLATVTVAIKPREVQPMPATSSEAVTVESTVVSAPATERARISAETPSVQSTQAPASSTPAATAPATSQHHDEDDKRHTGSRSLPEFTASSVDDVGREHEQWPSWSRIFDTVEFNADDFTTTSDGVRIRAARRSHPPRSHASLSESSGVPTEGANNRTATSTPLHRAADTAETVAALTEDVQKTTVPVQQQPAASETAPASPPRTTSHTAAQSPQVKSESALTAAVPFFRPVLKPRVLGECSPEFMSFMMECGGEGYAEDDEERRQRELQLLDVVDLTNLSDSGDEDDMDDEDDVVLIGASRNGVMISGVNGTLMYSSSHSSTNGRPVMGESTTSSVASSDTPSTVATEADIPGADAVAAAAAAAAAVKPIKVECMICEARGAERMMAKCEQCLGYYHRRCARDFGGEVKCWNCADDDLVDDSELTPAVHEETVSMLQVFRQDPSGSSDDDATAEGELEREDVAGDDDVTAADEQDEEMEDPDAFDSGDNALMSGRKTRSEWRWMRFVNESTSALEEDFRAVTSRIEQELSTSEGRARYSKGFATRESFNSEMNQVANHYAEIERERARAEARARLEAQAQAQAQAEAQAQAQAQTQAQTQGHAQPLAAVQLFGQVQSQGEVPHSVLAQRPVFGQAQSQAQAHVLSFGQAQAQALSFGPAQAQTQIQMQSFGQAHPPVEVRAQILGQVHAQAWTSAPVQAQAYIQPQSQAQVLAQSIIQAQRHAQGQQPPLSNT